MNYKKELLLFNITKSAVNKVKSVLCSVDNKDLKLRIYITGGGCNGFQYGFNLDDNINETDFIIEKAGISVIIDYMSFQYLIGGSVDYYEGLEGSRFVINNPNAKTKCNCGESFGI